MGPLRAAPLGFQQITSMSSAVGLTLPYGAQQARGTGCTLSGTTLTVGGTVTGAFAANQVVVGTGIPANTYIVGPVLGSTTQWQLSNACTTESAETVTGYANLGIPDLAIIKALTATVYWRDDGTAPSGTTGMAIQTTDPLFEYTGDLSAIQFLSATGGINISFYRLVG